MGESSEEREAALTAFVHALPARPYCADDPRVTLRMRRQDIALACRHIQVSTTWRYPAIVLDVDRSGAAFAAEEADLPTPTLTVINPVTAHAQLTWLLRYAVDRRNRKAEWSYRRARFAMIAPLDADPAYSQPVTQNPMHRAWPTTTRHCLYELEELAAESGPRPRITSHRREMAPGSGRNCRLFERLREFARSELRRVDSEGQLKARGLTLAIEANPIVGANYASAEKTAKTAAVIAAVQHQLAAQGRLSVAALARATELSRQAIYDHCQDRNRNSALPGGQAVPEYSELDTFREEC